VARRAEADPVCTDGDIVEAGGRPCTTSTWITSVQVERFRHYDAVVSHSRQAGRGTPISRRVRRHCAPNRQGRRLLLALSERAFPCRQACFCGEAGVAAFDGKVHHLARLLERRPGFSPSRREAGTATTRWPAQTWPELLEAAARVAPPQPITVAYGEGDASTCASLCAPAVYDPLAAGAVVAVRGCRSSGLGFVVATRPRRTP
jgi:hypothetical protein